MEIDQVVEYVARSYNIRPETLKTKTTLPYIAEARFMVIYVLRKILDVRSKHIIEALGTSTSKICWALKAINRKMEDPNFKQYFDGIIEGLNSKTPSSELAFERDLEEFERKCEWQGMCLVTKFMRISSTKLGRKYNVTTSNQLYYLLKNKKYAARRSDFRKMMSTCSTQNCVIHWKADEGEEFIMANSTVVEEDVIGSPDERIIYSIIQSAIEEKDERYFKSGLFSIDLMELNVENQKIIQNKLKEIDENLAHFAKIGFNLVKRMMERGNNERE